MKYIDADKLKAEIKKRINELEHDKYLSVDIKTARIAELHFIDRSIDSLQQPIGEEYAIEIGKHTHTLRVGSQSDIDNLIRQENQEQPERQMPNSTQLIAEWEKEKAMLEQKDFRGDAERMAYNAFLDGFIKGLGYESTK